MELNRGNLVSALREASSSERSPSQQQAELQLKTWETQSGYHYLLQEVYLNVDLPLQTRWLAIICFKNGIEKYWRSTRQNSIGKDEKLEIKKRLFDLVKEQNKQLAIQNAHAIARICRFDFPVEWPSLFDDLNFLLKEAESSGDVNKIHNLLIISNQIIKSIAMIRIGKAKLVMQTKIVSLIPSLTSLYLKFFQTWTTNMDLGLMEVNYLMLKNLRRIIPEISEQPHKNQDVNEFINATVDHLQLLISEHQKYSTDLIERFIKCYSKLYLNIINSNPTSFVLLPSSGRILMTFLSILESKAEAVYDENNPNQEFWEALALKSFLILKRIMQYIYKKGATTIRTKSDKVEIDTAIKYLTEQLFTQEVLYHLTDLIINWYLKLRPKDLEAWSSDPEEWINEESSTNWEYQIRPCAENFYQDLINFFPEVLSSRIMTRIQNELKLGKDNSYEEILVKDSLLCVLQLSSNILWDKLEFNSLLIDTLVPQLMAADGESSRVLKRRILLIIEEWIHLGCTGPNRVEIYKLLVSFLGSSEAKVVQLTASGTLMFVVDDYEFNKADFKPFINDLISLLLSLLPSMAFIESKLVILKSLAVLLERSNPLVEQSTCMSILSIIPGYWESSVNETMIHSSLLRILKNLVFCMNQNSFASYQVALPLISIACAEGSILAEDGYELWLTILQCNPKINILGENEPLDDTDKALIELLPLVVIGLLHSTEILVTVLSVIKGYTTLYPKLLFGNDIGFKIFEIVSGYLANMRDDAFVVFIPIMDTLLLVNSKDEAFLNNLVSSGLFNAMIHYITDPEQSVIFINKVFRVLSRLVLNNFEVFQKLVGTDFATILATWLKDYKSIGNPHDKKIALLALLTISSKVNNSSNLFISEQFSTIIYDVLEFLESTNETITGDCEKYHLDVDEDEIEEQATDEDVRPYGETARLNLIMDYYNPVFKVNLKSYLRECLEIIKTTLSNSEFEQLMKSVTPTDLEQLGLIMS